MRLFIGVNLPAAAKDALGAAAKELAEAGIGRAVPEGGFHITLAYIGETEPARVSAVLEAMREAAAGQAAVPLALGGYGHFGKPESAILYVRPLPDTALSPLADRLRSALARRGLPFDPQPFAAHVTLARKAALPLPPAILPPPPIPFAARSLTLFESLREEGRLTYRPLYEIPFG